MSMRERGTAMPKSIIDEVPGDQVWVVVKRFVEDGKTCINCTKTLSGRWTIEAS
jgi:hypothetical protein